MSNKRLFISFSGGESSAYMARWCLTNWSDRYEDIVILFANTGQENPETLDFIKKCETYFGFPVVWVEAVVHPGRKGCTHKVVTYETASRNGEPFEEMIKKYGISNKGYPHCTRELKLNPMTSYIRSIGWKKGTYDTAIGIRADEIDRVAKNHDENNIVYPLLEGKGVRKPAINLFWSQQPFRLELKGYQGNCSWCWKKSLRKQLTLITETPYIYDFPRRMEKEYSMVRPERGEQYFFRGKLSTEDLFKLRETESFTPAADDSVIYPENEIPGLELDVSGGGCSESCEIFHDNGED